MVLPKHHLELLTAVYTVLVENLQLEDGLLPLLRTADLISRNQLERYQTSAEYPTRQRRVGALLRDLEMGSQGEATLAKFLECLYASGQRHLVEHLKIKAKEREIPESELQDEHLREKLQEDGGLFHKEPNQKKCNEEAGKIRKTLFHQRRNSQEEDEQLREKLPEGSSLKKELQDLRMDYRQKLQYVPLLSWDTWHTPGLMDQLYTRLHLVEEKPHGGLSKKISLEHYTDILKQQADEALPPRHILIRGEPGIGKTTLMKKLALDWATQEEGNSTSITPFKVVFIIFLHSVEQNATLAEIIKKLLGSCHSTDTISSFLESKAENILFLLDGYDEYHNQSQECTKLIKGEMLRKATVMITTRPKCMLPTDAHRDRLVEIKGFGEEEQKKYIQQFFDDDQARGTKLLNEIRDSEMWDFCYIPLLMMLLCFVYKATNTVLGNLPELYNKVIALMYKRQKGKMSNEKSPLINLKDILQGVGKLALKTLFSGQQEFTVPKEMDTKVFESAVEIGLLHVFHTDADLVNDTKSASFLHKTFQEYCATLWLVHTSDYDFSQIYSPNDKHSLWELQNLIKFAPGMVCEGLGASQEEKGGVTLSAKCRKGLARFLDDINTMAAQWNRTRFKMVDDVLFISLDDILSLVKAYHALGLAASTALQGWTGQYAWYTTYSDQTHREMELLAEGDRLPSPLFANNYNFLSTTLQVGVSDSAHLKLYHSRNGLMRMDTTRLTVLVLYDATIDASGWEVLLQAPLKVMMLDKTDVKEKPDPPLNPAPHQSHSSQQLQYVYLSTCTLCNSAAQILARTLTTAPRLQYLSLESTILFDTEVIWMEAQTPQELKYVKIYNKKPDGVNQCIARWAKLKSKTVLWMDIRNKPWGWLDICFLPFSDNEIEETHL